MCKALGLIPQYDKEERERNRETEREREKIACHIWGFTFMIPEPTRQKTASSRPTWIQIGDSISNIVVIVTIIVIVIMNE
jgi:hypothetical protein